MSFPPIKAVRTAALLARTAWNAATGGPLPPRPGCRRTLIVFTRYPEPGTTKTRLMPALGEKGAAELQRRMTERVCESALRLALHFPLALEVRHEGGNEALMKQWLGRRFTHRPQPGGDLGERMHGAFERAFSEGARSAVIVGSDCPGIDAALLRQAYRALEGNDLVLGPAADGGYYLIGLRRPASALFQGIEWGTGSVLRRTVEKAREAGMGLHLLRELRDVDRPADYEAADLELMPDPGPRISVIVPTLNEAERLPRTLQAAQRGRNVEVIVADGGSSDDTRKVAAECGARVIEETGGRGRQLNAGAATAEGDVLLFLHADTRLPPGWDTHARRLLLRRGVELGAFELAIDGEGAGLRLVEAWVNGRSRWLRLPYGDQALFLRRSFYEELGGFPDMPLMEDYELVRRALRRGGVGILDRPVLTSARRWRKVGVVKTTFINHATVLAYRLGVPADALARWYRRRKS
jgi:hypothetical protein